MMQSKKDNPSYRIGVDLMGSDSSPSHLFESVCSIALATSKTTVWEVFALPSICNELKSSPHPPNLCFSSTPHFVAMEDDPLLALRQKKEASLFMAIKQLKKNHIQGLVTAGNTGALIAAATHFLPKLAGIKRPALLATISKKNSSLVILDVGGNVACKAENLVQFAQMGAAYQRQYLQCKTPRVGLLNIGIESHKGHQELQKTWQLLKNSPKDFHFIGNIEAIDLFSESIDVLVTDGFTGNVLIKTAEGISKHFLTHFPKELLKTNELLSFCNQFDYTKHPGALLYGVKGTIIKCHGSTSSQAFLKSLEACYHLTCTYLKMRNELP